MKTLITFLFSLCTMAAAGQAVSASAWSFKGKKIEYAYYAPDSANSEALFAFYNSADPTWKHVTWGQELSWLADQRRAVVVAPSESPLAMDSTFIEGWVSSLSDSLDPKKSRFISLGAGVSKLSGLLAYGVSGLIIAPSDSLSGRFRATNSVVGVIDSRKGDSTSSVINELERSGAWVFSKMVIGEDPYYFDGHKEVIKFVMHQVDSMQTILNDSLKRSKLRSVVTQKGPDVLRQGKKFETSVFIAEEGVFDIAVLNLSASPMVEREVFLGKGHHTIEIPTKDLDWGVYKVEIDGPGIIVKQKLMIRG